jgi:hypothetical protein
MMQYFKIQLNKCRLYVGFIMLSTSGFKYYIHSFSKLLNLQTLHFLKYTTNDQKC